MSDREILKKMLDEAGVRYTDRRDTGELSFQGVVISFKPDGKLDWVKGKLTRYNY